VAPVILAYQPELLPCESWGRILNRLDDHFGGSFELDEETKKAILGYLQTNAAEHSTAKRAVKILRSSGRQVPARITEIPYIRKKHHDISAATLSASQSAHCQIVLHVTRGLKRESIMMIS